MNRDEVGRLKLAIFSSDQETDLRCICFVGVSGGEGCSTMVKNLAVEIAEDDGSKVLLVDGSIDDPSLHKSFNMDLGLGLTDALCGGCEVSEACQPTNITNLHIMTGGSSGEDTANLLNPLLFSKVTDEIKAKYDYVLIDAGSVFSSAFALLLATLADGLVLVARPGSTRWAAAKAALREIKRSQPNIIGVAYNRRRNWIPNWLYRRL